MSARQWVPNPVHRDAVATGNAHAGAVVYPDRLGGTWHVSASCGSRVIGEGGIPTRDEAKTLASEWLDRREAATPGYCSHHSDQREPVDSCAAWRRTNAGAQKGGTTSGEPAAKPEPKPAEVDHAD